MAEAVCGSSVSMGLHVSTGTADQVNSYLRETAITVALVPGLFAWSLLSAQENLAKTIARDKPVSTLNVLANICEHRYNITMMC